ncbi:MAG TPA: ABC transporter permease, partial [Polyangiaceae bacterium]
MSPFQTSRIAARAVIRNKMRSFLTTLGVIIGVGAVIAMMAIGSGAKAQVEAAFAAMGTDLLVVLPGSSSASGVHGGFGSQPTLTWEDLAAIEDPTQIASVKIAAPALRSNMPIVSEDQNWTTSVTGTTPEYFEIRNWPADHGATLTQEDLDTTAKVIVLGATVAEKLYGASANPTGQSVRVGTSQYRIAGVLRKKGQSPTGQDYDDAAFIPVSTFGQKVQGGLKKYLSGTIYVQASGGQTARAQADVTNLLRERHHLTQNDDDDFSIRNLSEIAGAQQQGTDTMTTLLASVAAVSLLVGGIGIMNIMLVSVTERTREIGLRMAVGARAGDILKQFLAEAVVLSLTGGAIGIMLGWGCSYLVRTFLRWPTESSPGAVVAAVVVSATVGVAF